MTDKSTLRAESLAKRQSISLSQALQSCGQLAQHLLPLLPPTRQTISGYVAIRGEIDVLPALSHIMDRHTLCLPVINAPAEPLEFRQWMPGEKLHTGSYSIKVPEEGAELLVPDIMLVPLVAFDRAGNRLGYGAGYYDRSIAALRKSGKKLLVIGVGYSTQQLEHIPVDAHDQKLDAIITEKESVVLS